MYIDINKNMDVDEKEEDSIKGILLEELKLTNLLFLQDYTLTEVLKFLELEGYVKVYNDVNKLIKDKKGSKNTKDFDVESKGFLKTEKEYKESYLDSLELTIYKVRYNYNAIIERSVKDEKARNLEKSIIENKKRKNKVRKSVKKVSILDKIRNLRKLNKSKNLWRYNQTKECYITIN